MSVLILLDHQELVGGGRNPCPPLANQRLTTLGVPPNSITLCTLYSVHCVLCTLYTVYSVLCTLCTLYSVYCVLCSLCTLAELCTLCTLYSVLYVKNNSSIQPPHSLTTCPTLIPRLAWVRGYLSQTIVLTLCSDYNEILNLQLTLVL